VRVLLPASMLLALCLAACGGSEKKPVTGPPTRPDCECGKKMTEDGDACACPHCMGRDTGMEPVPCACADREGK